MQSLRNFLSIGLVLFCTALNAGWNTPPPTDLVPAPIAGATYTIPVVGIDNAGHAVSAWLQNNAGILTLQVSYYDINTDTWSVPLDLDTAISVLDFIQVAVDPATGNATVVYTYANSVLVDDNVVKAAQYTFTTHTWSTPVNVSILDPVLGVSSPTVGIDANLNSIVVWVSFDSNLGLDTLFASRSAFGSNIWSIPIPLVIPSTDTENFPQINVQSDGNAVVVWSNSGGGGINIKSAAYNVGTNTWSAAIDVTPLTPGTNDGSPQIDSEFSGQAIIAFGRVITFSGMFSVESSTYDYALNTWTALPTIIADPTAQFLAIFSLDSINGRSVASWTRGAIGSLSVYAAYHTNSGWGAPTLLSGNEASGSDTGISNSGNAFVIWNSGFASPIIQVSEYNFLSSTWSAPLDLVSNVSPPTTAPKIATNAGGTSVAVWQLMDPPSSNIQSGTFVLVIDAMQSSMVAVPTSVDADGVASSTITVTLRDTAGVPIEGHSVSLTPNGGSSVITPLIGVSDINGEAIFSVTDTVAEVIVYTAEDLVNDIVITQTAQVTFNEVPINTPANFVGKFVKNQFLNMTEYVNVLSWSPVAHAVYYKLYQNGVLIRTISASERTKVIIYNIKKHKHYTYALVAVNNLGHESPPAIITVSQKGN